MTNMTPNDHDFTPLPDIRDSSSEGLSVSESGFSLDVALTDDFSVQFGVDLDSGSVSGGISCSNGDDHAEIGGEISLGQQSISAHASHQQGDDVAEMGGSVGFTDNGVEMTGSCRHADDDGAHAASIDASFNSDGLDYEINTASAEYHSSNDRSDDDDPPCTSPVRIENEDVGLSLEDLADIQAEDFSMFSDSDWLMAD